MPTLNVDHEATERVAGSGRTVYLPIVGRITGTSRYNPEQYRIADLDGFWQHNGTLLVLDGTYRMVLATKPKQSPDARTPYMDILRAEITDEQPDGTRGSVPGSNGAQAYSSTPTAAAPTPTPGRSQAAPQRYGSTTDERIKQAQVYNNTTLVLAAMIQQPKTARHPVDNERYEATWARYELLSKLFWTGKRPEAGVEAADGPVDDEEGAEASPGPSGTAGTPQTEPPAWVEDAPSAADGSQRVPAEGDEEILEW